MYAIVEIAGHQYKVSENDVLFVNRQQAADDALVYDRVLLVKQDDGTVKVGAPIVEGIQVTATILEQVKADKVIVFKKKRRKGYKVKNGHRQLMSQIKITGIGAAAKAKKSSKKAAPEAKTKTEE